MLAAPIIGKSYGATTADDFPGFSPAKWHCEMTLTIDQKCNDVFPQIKSLVARNRDAAFPMGNYTLLSDKPDEYVWAHRLTYTKKYTDDVIWQMEQKPADDPAEEKCKVHARSQSQVLAISMTDHNVNFCNMYNILWQVDPSIKDQPSKYTVGKCLLGHSNYKDCDRY